ncbi:hypothetical protein [uncultured Tissierella sp.]|jgi:hypothetical protein|uniref:hypothetical protein n=1 Tax=uncultured Tissierella sp. TaxID=448160 RepID=UPI002804F9F0|nr:hypothetical protein [uncultured Tissierella sp.]MDU5082816.1 hypothetical protein [Bacillota bacterium]
MTNIYEKQEWIDHIVERPGTFRETQNADGSITHISEEGNILEEGSPFSANRMNHIEDGIYNVSRQANINKDDITSLMIEVAILKGNALNGIGHNMFIVNFVNLDSVELAHGVYDEVGKRLVI